MIEQKRLIEALLFASPAPLTEAALKPYAGEENIRNILRELQKDYAGRGINLIQIENSWCFRTALDLAGRIRIESQETRKLSKAALETLAIIAYHQPVTRSEIEEIRGVSLSKGTLDLLFEAGFVGPKGRRQTPGRPLTWGTMQGFLDHFALKSLEDLPGIEELKAAGLLDKRPAYAAYGSRAHDDAEALPEDIEED